MFTVVLMPCDSEGKGPEMNPKYQAYTLYQVWDDCNVTIFESFDKFEAEIVCERLNSQQPI